MNRSFSQELGRDATDREIAAKLEIDAERVAMARASTRPTISLESPVGADHGAAVLGDFLEDASAASAFDAAAQSGVARLTSEMLSSLHPRRRKILKMRFAIGSREHTLEEVGAVFGVTRQRVGQVEAQALARLRRASRARSTRCRSSSKERRVHGRARCTPSRTSSSTSGWPFATLGSPTHAR